MRHWVKVIKIYVTRCDVPDCKTMAVDIGDATMNSYPKCRHTICVRHDRIEGGCAACILKKRIKGNRKNRP